jgi:hypothetical protein
MMQNQLIPAPEQFGISTQKAAEIEAMFTPLLKEVSALEEEYNRIINADFSDKQVQKVARDLRLLYKNKRNEVTKLHKELKAFYLAGGRFVDGWRNSFLMAIGDNEKQLKQIEDYERVIKEREIKRLQEERSDIISEYTDVIPHTLGEMSLDQFNIYLTGLKAMHEKEIERQKKDNLRQERANILMNEGVKIDAPDIAEINEGEFLKQIRTEKAKQRAYKKMRELTPYKEFIPNFNNLDCVGMTERDFKDILNTAKNYSKIIEKRMAEIAPYLMLGYDLSKVKTIGDNEFKEMLNEAKEKYDRLNKRGSILAKLTGAMFEAITLANMSEKEFDNIVNKYKEDNLKKEQERIEREKTRVLREKKQKEDQEKERIAMMGEQEKWRAMAGEIKEVMSKYEFTKLAVKYNNLLDFLD